MIKKDIDSVFKFFQGYPGKKTEQYRRLRSILYNMDKDEEIISGFKCDHMFYIKIRSIIY